MNLLFVADFDRHCHKVLLPSQFDDNSVDSRLHLSLVQTLKEDYSQNDHMRRYCRVCREVLRSDAKYFVCEKCHRELILAEDDRNYIEHSRLHY